MKLLILSLLLTLFCISNAEEFTVIYSGFSKDSQYWKAYSKAVINKSDSLGVTLIDITPDVVDPQTQLTSLFSIFSGSIDGIIIGPQNVEILTPFLDSARKLNIPIIAADTPLNHPSVKSLITIDNFALAKQIGQSIVKNIEQKSEVLIIGGTSEHPNGSQRIKGVISILDSSHITYSIKYADWREEKAFLITSQFIEDNHNIGAIFACNDAMAMAAQYVIEKNYRGNSVLIYGFDAIPKALEMIKLGKITGTVKQHPEKLGTATATAMFDILNKKKTDDVIFIDAEFIEGKSK